MKYLIYLGCFLLMIITNSVARILHIEQVGLVSNIILFCLAISDILTNASKYRRDYNEEFAIIKTTCFIIMPFNFVIGGLELVKGTFFFIVSLLFISIFLKSQKDEIKFKIQKLILIFFIMSCLLAIIEKKFQFNLFPYHLDNSTIDEITIMEGGFRSSAFLGHPLTNAVCISTIMAFIILSSYKIVHKTILLFLGFISILCFNAKAAIVIWVIIFFYLIYLILFKHKPKIPLLFYIIICVSVVLIFTLVVNEGFGDRITQGELVDGSAKTRIDVFNTFDYISTSDFWFGNPNNYIYVTKKLGAGGVENSYIVLILQYGLPISILLIILYIFWIRKLLKGLILNAQLLILVSFILLGSANNSLSSSTPWIFFILCYNAFLPDLQNWQKLKKLTSNKIRHSNYNLIT